MTRWVKGIAVLLVFVGVGCSPEPAERPAGPATDPVEVGPDKTGKADGFDWGDGCQGGTGTFTQAISENAVVTVGSIPADRVNVEIKLSCAEDVDIQLTDEDGTKIVHWPDGLLNDASEASVEYKGVTITWSGYNGDGSGLGNEFIRIEGATPSALVMKAYGYRAGQARVDYSWDAKPDCESSGSGSFTQIIEKDAVADVGTIPAGLSDVKIQLVSPVDIDIQLFDEDGTKVVHWPDGILDGESRASAEYKGVTVTWSGYNGDGTGKGNEYIEIAGKTQSAFVMKVFGYEAGEATVTYSWGSGSAASAEVLFSPASSTASSHVARVVEEIEAAQRSVDIAMYSLGDKRVNDALQEALARGVEVRFIFHEAQKDRWDPAGSDSAKLEEAGIDVRYASKSKVMHHKFMIVDGPRADDQGHVDQDLAQDALLVTGSGNWSYGAQTQYDENTLFLRGVPELALRFQEEFNRLWTYSHDFTWQSFPYSTAAVLDASTFPDSPEMDAYFTSANFAMNKSFTVIKGSYDVAEALAKEIQAATKSVYVASGHFRSWPIYDALLQLRQDRPEVDIKIYLDGQEYISKSYNDKQDSERQTCLTAAGSDATAQLECHLSGNYFSYEAHAEGIPLRFKYYSYRWDYHYAKQMHHKYIIIDGKTVITGSYNLSDNAERGTLENVVVLRGGPFQAVVDAFGANFDELWHTDEDGKLLAALQQAITTSDTIPLVFDSMSLTWTQVSELKDLIEDNCSSLFDEDYRANPHKHTTCPRNP